MPQDATIQKTTRRIILSAEEFLEALRGAGVAIPDNAPFSIQPQTIGRDSKVVGGITLPYEGLDVAVIWDE